MGKMKQGKEREYWDGCAALLSRVVMVGLNDEVTAEQRPAGGDVEHGWTWVGREEHSRLRDQEVQRPLSPE